MAITKEQKQKILDDLKDKLARQKAIVLIGITGLKMKDLSELRRKLKGIGANLKVVKKTLAAIALKENKLEFKKDEFKEEIAFVFGFDDEIAPAKTVYQLSRANENIKILGGFLGNQFKQQEEMIAIAQLPSREELLARVVGSISSPISGFVNVLQGNIKGLIYSLEAISKLKQ